MFHANNSILSKRRELHKTSPTYKVKKGKKNYIADPGKGLIKHDLEVCKSH